MLSLPKKSKPPISEAEDSDVYQFLHSLREFACVSAQELKALADSSRFASIDAGQYLANEGEDESLYGFVVVSGRFAMLKNSSNGKELIVELLQAGDIFGLLLTLANHRGPAELSARAIQNSKVLWVPISGFTQILKTHPILFKEFAANLLLCLQSSYSLSRGLAHDRVEVRIATVLSSLAIKFAKPTPADIAFTVNFTRQQIADLTGTTPETAIRVTRQMQRDGLIDIKRPGVIRVVSLAALQEFAES